ncbi:MAG: cysteine hydrolase, partial [Oscillospiraceae bacterium]|nr:cysteine hydrolase [Oscillospiraceae bacterium]
PEVAKLMDKCNKAEIPVVTFADCHKEDCSEFASFPPHCIENTSESELVDELKKVGGYFLMKKNSTNGFHEKIFKQCLIQNPTTNTFIVVGDCTDICVMQFCLTLKTWYTQQNRNIDIYIPVNAVETYDAPGHDADFMNIAAYKLMKDSGIRFVKEIE